MKLGDVLTMRNGKTVEVLNTDAEGRLILADALSFAAENRPARILDLATLTGACMVALGPKVAGLFSNDDALRPGRARGLPADRANGPGGCRSMTTTRTSSRATWPTSRTWAGSGAGPSRPRSSSSNSSAQAPGLHLDIAGPSWSDAENSPATPAGPAASSGPWSAFLENAEAS